MRALLLALLALLALALAEPARANDAGAPSVLRIETNVFPAPPGSEDMRPRWPAHLSAEEHYRRGRIEKGAGIGLTTVGIVFGSASALLLLGALETSRTCDGFECMGAAFLGAGSILSAGIALPFLGSGIALWRHGHRRMVQAEPYLRFDPRQLPRRHAGVVLRATF